MPLLSSSIRAAWRALPPRARLFFGAGAVLSLATSVAHLLPRRSTDLPDTPRPVHVAILDRDAFAARIAAAQRAASTPQQRCRRLGLLDLSLVDDVEAQAALFPTSLAERVLGAPFVPAYYVVDSDTIFTLRGDDPSVRHEWIHALDDQHGRRMRDARAGHTTDEQLALRAAIEGTAISYLGTFEPRLHFTANLDQDAWVLAYSIGPDYVRRMAGDDLNRALALHPTTVYEVLFGTTPPPLPTPFPPPPLNSGESVLCTDRIGVLGLLAALARPDVSSAEAQAIALAWVGDRLDVIRAPTGRRTIWTIAFSDSTAAQMWQAGPGARITLASTNTRIHAVVIHGPRRPSPFDRLGR